MNTAPNTFFSSSFFKNKYEIQQNDYMHPHAYQYFRNAKTNKHVNLHNLEQAIKFDADISNYDDTRRVAVFPSLECMM